MPPEDGRPVSNCLLDLAPPDIKWFLERSDIVLVPIGSCEQHGAHLPLGTDTITALEVARRAAEKADVPYTPPFWCGYSPQHMREPGTGVGTITFRAATLNEGLYKPYAERYIGMLDGLLENPPDETPGWHASELETSQVLAHDESLVRMDRAAEDRAQVPRWLPQSFIKQDGAPDVEFRGYQYFVFPMDHDEFSRTGVIGNPMTATAEKGDAALTRFADHLVAAIDEFRPLQAKVKRRAFEDRV